MKNIEDTSILSPANLKKEEMKVFQGGHAGELHRMLGVSSGNKILYVGDHIFADILRSKESAGWRTCLIIPELEKELQSALTYNNTFEEIQLKRREQHELDEKIDQLLQQKEAGMNVEKELNETIAASDELKLKVKDLLELYNAKFNPYWGQLFKAGHQDSRFAKQAMDYACLYTSKATNLLFVDPNRTFRPMQDFMSHDQMILQTINSSSAIKPTL